MDRLCKVGDVIKCDRFSSAYYNWTKIEPTKTTDGLVFLAKSNLVLGNWNNNTVTYTKHYNRDGSKEEGVVSISAYDKTRGSAEFVVTRAEMEGGSGPGARDPFPNGHHVTVKRLMGGEYYEGGETFNFYQSGCFMASITVSEDEIDLVGRMTMTFI